MHATLLHWVVTYRLMKALLNAALQDVNLAPDEVSNAFSLQSCAWEPTLCSLVCMQNGLSSSPQDNSYCALKIRRALLQSSF